MKIPDLSKSFGMIDKFIMDAYDKKWFWLAGAAAFVLLILAFAGFVMQLLK